MIKRYNLQERSKKKRYKQFYLRRNYIKIPVLVHRIILENCTRSRKERKSKENFLVYLRKEQWIDNNTHVNVLDLCFFLTATFQVLRTIAVLFSWGNQTSPLYARMPQVGLHCQWVDYLSSKRLYHSILSPGPRECFRDGCLRGLVWKGGYLRGRDMAREAETQDVRKLSSLYQICFPEV